MNIISNVDKGFLTVRRLVNTHNMALSEAYYMALELKVVEQKDADKLWIRVKKWFQSGRV